MAPRTLLDELAARAAAFIDRRGGAGMRRGGRGRGSVLGRKVDRTIYGIQPAAGSYYGTAAGGGESGDASGFGGLLLAQANRLSTGAVRFLAGRASTGDVGYGFYINTANGLFFGARNGANTALVQTGAYTLQPSDVGKILCIAGRHEGNAVRLTVNRDITPASAAITGFTAHTGPHFLGALGAVATALDVVIIDHVTYRGVLSEAQIRTVMAQARALGRFPDSIDGVALAHRWPERAALKSLVAPAVLDDVVTKAPADAMTKTGAPIVVAIDQTAPKAWGYETQPITYGVRAPSMADYYVNTTGALAGHPAGTFWWLWLTVHSQAVASGSRVVFSRRGPSGTFPGWNWQTLGANASLTFALGTDNAGGANYQAPLISIPAADVGKMLLVYAVLDPAALRVRSYTKRAEQGTGTTVAGTYLPPASDVNLMLLRRVDGLTADGVTIHAVGGGYAVPSLATIQAHTDAVVATETAQRMPGVDVQWGWDFKLAATAPAQVPERQSGADPLIRQGAPSMAPTHARAWNF